MHQIGSNLRAQPGSCAGARLSTTVIKMERADNSSLIRLAGTGSDLKPWRRLKAGIPDVNESSPLCDRSARFWKPTQIQGWLLPIKGGFEPHLKILKGASWVFMIFFDTVNLPLLQHQELNPWFYFYLSSTPLFSSILLFSAGST